ncbi:MAG: CARDB domain-containing protein [Thiohalocapsa sp.]
MKTVLTVFLVLLLTALLALRPESDGERDVDQSVYYFPPPLVVEPLAPPPDPDDVLDRDPNGVLVLPNIKVSDTDSNCFDDGVPTGCAQNETTVAVNPTDHDNWVAGANDYTGDNLIFDRPQSNCGFYSSQDSGQTWSGGLLPLQNEFGGAGDPSLVFDGAGNLYYACMNFTLSGALGNLGLAESAMYVFKSTDGGTSFGAPTQVVSSADGPGHPDKEHIAADPMSGNLYMAWMQSGDIRFAGSDDGGASFQAPSVTDNVFVNDPEADDNQGAVVATLGAANPEGGGAPAPEVYVAWISEVDQGTATILFDRSSDGGLTFGNDVTVENNVIQFPFRVAGSGCCQSNPRTTLLGEFGDPVENQDNAFRVNSFPSLDVCRNITSEFYGDLFLVFADNRFGDGDIFFKRSTDGGETWPGGFTRRINDDTQGNGKDQFFPWIRLDENCKINVAFYDRRDDPDNLRFHLYFAHSTDGGQSFSQNARITVAPSTNAQFLGSFIGDYQQVAATIASSATFHHDIDRALPVWMDTTQGAQDVFAATALQTKSGTWINVDVDLVLAGPEQQATNLEFVFPGNVADDFSDFYHGPANPFQNHLVIFDPADNETTLSFYGPEPGPLSVGDLAHVGFVFNGNPEVVRTFWTGSGRIGDFPMLSLDAVYNPITETLTPSLCNDRNDGHAISVPELEVAVLDLPLELEAMNATDVPPALAAQGASLDPIVPPGAAIAPGACMPFPILEPVKLFQALLIKATLGFPTGDRANRAVLYAQKVAKDAREDRTRPGRHYHYAAKVVCGVQPDTRDLRLARGHYATIVNVRNPGPRAARIDKSLALAIPPGSQEPGDLEAIASDVLGPRLALAVDCEDIRRRVYGGELPASFIDGFVTLVSDRSLDVVGVYSTATLNAEGTAEDHSSIHVEPVAERIIEDSQDTPERADLVIDPDVSTDTICRERDCQVSVRFRVRNIGAAPPGSFSVRLVRSADDAVLQDLPVAAGLAPGAIFTDTTTIDLVLEGDPSNREICIRADSPFNQVPESDESNNERCFGF